MKFRSRLSFLYYVFIAAMLAILGLSIYKVIIDELDVPGLLFINLLSVIIAYFAFFRYNCRFHFENDILTISYIPGLQKKVRIFSGEIISYEIDEVKSFRLDPYWFRRYHTRLLIETPTGTHLIKYLMGENSEEKLFALLKKIGNINKIKTA